MENIVRGLKEEFNNMIQDLTLIENKERAKEIAQQLCDLGCVDSADLLINKWKARLQAKKAVEIKYPNLNEVDIDVLTEEYNELVADYDEIMEFVFENPEPHECIQKEVGVKLQAITQRMNEIQVVKDMLELN